MKLPKYFPGYVHIFYGMHDVIKGTVLSHGSPGPSGPAELRNLVDPSGTWWRIG